MQKELPRTPKLRKFRRKPQTTSTPEPAKKNLHETTLNIKPTNFNRRMTMAHFDIASGQSSRRTVRPDRPSVLPSQCPLDVTRLTDLESDDVEFALLYDRYLQKLMTELILKKAAEERKNLVVQQLATLHKELEHDVEKLHKLKMREQDIMKLTEIQNEVDKQIKETDNTIKTKDIKELTVTLSELYKVLKPVDVLRCENMVLPETPEEWGKLEETVKTCGDTLKSIVKLIGTKGEAYQSVNEDVKDFLKTYNDIEDDQKKLEKSLGSLQELVLKTASLCLKRNED